MGASGGQEGPTTAAALLAMVARGEVSATAWVFETGTEGWISLQEVQGRLRALSIG